MNSEHALRIASALVSKGRILRWSPASRETKAIIFETRSRRRFAIEINDVKSRNFASRTKLVCEAAPGGQMLDWDQAASIPNVEITATQFGSSAYKAKGCRLQPNNQRSAYVSDETAFLTFLDWYEEADVKTADDSLVGTEGGTALGLTVAPTNRILYGPPGTGKTFATARHALALIEGADWLDIKSHDDLAVRARYRELVAANQIELVTFHQSYAYEDFIEGLRPTLGVDEEETQESDETKRTPVGGFELRPVPGVFHRISTRAERARLAAHDPTDRSQQPFEIGKRRVFKMSIGRAGSQDHMFDAAIAGGYTALGWGRGEDWSDSKYRNYDEVFKRANEIKSGTSGNAGDVVQVWQFRRMNVGDVIVISRGVGFARAIGVVTGDYYRELKDSMNYEHRRKVDWRVVPDEPIPVGEIYGTTFAQASCYELAPEKLKRPALERLLSEGRTATMPSVEGNGAAVSADRPNQFVLIIDEINRANISKVFGELITLLEADKRLGQDNALTVTLPYSGKSFGVPDNLHVLGTMNTADRSIALLDTALRRRFEFRELMPDPSLLPEELDGVPLRRLLTTLNERIEYLFDREHQIGHAFFIHCANRADIDDVMRRKVLPLLAEYFYEDWSRIAVVLGDTEGKRFLAKVSLPTPPGLSDDGVNEVRIRWTVRESFSLDAYDDLA